jgi:hypothetical protein
MSSTENKKSIACRKAELKVAYTQEVRAIIKTAVAEAEYNYNLAVLELEELTGNE